MDNPTEATNDQQKSSDSVIQVQTDKELTRKKLEARGHKQVSLSDYESLQSKKAKKKPFKLPVHLKIVFGTPFLIIFCCGVLFIPYMIFLIATGKFKSPTDNEAKKDFSYENIAKKEGP